MEKMAPILVTILLAMILTPISAGTTPTWRKMSKAEFNCTSPGFACRSCKEAVLCIHEQDGSLVPLEGEICTGKETCMNGKCTTAFNDKCNTAAELFQFKCLQEGVFPDPYDCTKYHMCPKKDQLSYVVECPAGWAFDTRVMLCSLKISPGTECAKPVRTCDQLSQGPIAGNSRLYYLCRKDATLDPSGTLYFPSLMHCVADMIYVHGRCIDPTQDLNIVDGKCTFKGNFYSARGCRTYNECNVNKAPVKKTCAAGKYFNLDMNKCVDFGCGFWY